MSGRLNFGEGFNRITHVIGQIYISICGLIAVWMWADTMRPNIPDAYGIFHKHWDWSLFAHATGQSLTMIFWMGVIFVGFAMLVRALRWIGDGFTQPAPTPTETYRRPEFQD